MQNDLFRTKFDNYLGQPVHPRKALLSENSFAFSSVTITISWILNSRLEYFSIIFATFKKHFEARHKLNSIKTL